MCFSFLKSYINVIRNENDKSQTFVDFMSEDFMSYTAFLVTICEGTLCPETLWSGTVCPMLLNFGTFVRGLYVRGLFNRIPNFVILVVGNFLAENILDVYPHNCMYIIPL